MIDISNKQQLKLLMDLKEPLEKKYPFVWNKY